jgi:hypothetical protein
MITKTNLINRLIQNQRLVLSFLAVIIFTPRLNNSDAFINVDGCIFWLGRSLKFYKALYRFDFSATHISDHPCVTLMILTGEAMLLAGLIKYNTLSLWFHKADLLFYAKMPIAVTTGLGILLL